METNRSPAAFPDQADEGVFVFCLQFSEPLNSHTVVEARTDGASVEPLLCLARHAGAAAKAGEPQDLSALVNAGPQSRDGCLNETL